MALPKATLAPVSAMAPMSERAARRRGGMGPTLAPCRAVACGVMPWSKLPGKQGQSSAGGGVGNWRHVPHLSWICPPRVELATKGGSAVMAELSPASIEIAILLAGALIYAF